MGYKSKDIAAITEPRIISLAGSLNFVQFASKPTVKTYQSGTLKVNLTNALSDIPTKSAINIIEPSGTIHAFVGTPDIDAVGPGVFYVSADASETAENLAELFLADPWVSANYSVTIPFVASGPGLVNGDTIAFVGKGAGAEYIITIATPGNVGNVAYLLTWVNVSSHNGDSISGEEDTAEIELDVYTNPPVVFGHDDRPITPETFGDYAATLNKTYSGTPLWFQLNNLFSQYGGYNKPRYTYGWFATGSYMSYRFIAKVIAANSFAFYQSNVLYVLNGYGYASDAIDLNRYVYPVSIGGLVKLLTNKPRTQHQQGQTQYLNFIYKDTGAVTLQVVYRAYSTSGALLGTYYDTPIDNTALSLVNTCVLKLDAVVASYPKTELIKVALSIGITIVSEDLEYEINPPSLHLLRQFTFLNRLGGWDSFNFDADIKKDIKPTSQTFNKTPQPGFSRGDSAETSYSTSLDQTITIEGAPVSDAVANWLNELAAARVIYDAEGNYVLRQDFTLSFNSASPNMQAPVFKYKLSETYTNE